MRDWWRPLLALLRLSRVVLHVGHGLLVLALRFPSLHEAARHRYIAWWSSGLLRCMGVTVHLHGSPRTGASLLVANHVSWLDIAALHSAVPQARFVSKADVLHWPVLGWMVKSAGTLFIERERKRDALRVVHAMAEALQAGQTVAVFPEGTTGPGPELLPFHANLLQAAIATATPVQPAVLRFSQGSQRFSGDVAYVGDTSLAQSLWRVATARGVSVHVQLLSPMASAHAERRALAETLRETMSNTLHADVRSRENP